MENRDTNTGALARQSQGGLQRPVPGSTARYNPLQEMQEQMRRMDALFNRIFGYEAFPSSIRPQFPMMEYAEPAADIYETDTDYILHVALPGVDPQDITLEATDESILLTARRRSPFDVNQPNNAQQTGSQSQNNQAGAQTSQGASPAASSNQGDGKSNAGAPNVPHTQHRQSGAFSQSTLRLGYTFPTPINPDTARANFRNGMLELNLQKQQPARSRTVPVEIGAAGAHTTGAQPTNMPTSGSTMHEGAPGNKMGESFTPNAGEDHTLQAQSIGARTEHQPGRDVNPIAAGQTNPMASSTPIGSREPAEAKRPQ